MSQADKIILVTKKGIVKKIDPKQFREMGRAARGLRGIKLDADDEIVGVTTIVEDV